MPMDDVSDVLSEALAGRLALQMSVSSLAVIEEWMDMPLTRWLDSIPLPMEMPDASSPPVRVTLGGDGRRVRWEAGGPPEGVIPKLVEYLRRAGATPGDFQRIDQAGQALEPAVVGSWIEVRPGSIETGWYLEDRLPTERLAELLSEGAWLRELGDGWCTRVTRGIRDSPATQVTTEVTIDLAGEDRAARLAAAATALDRAGLALEQAASLLAGDLSLVVRARAQAVESMMLSGSLPGSHAVGGLCAALGIELAPPIEMVAQAIGAGEPAALGLEMAPGGTAVLVSYLAGSKVAAHVN
jgi:hypothetical protein